MSLKATKEVSLMAISLEKIKIKMAEIPKENVLPPLLSTLNVQQVMKSSLSEYDEVYVGYGYVNSTFPYRHQDGYNRREKPGELDVIVLENDYMRAEFLPSLGARLWSLVDKQSGRELFLNNERMQFANLAIRNAWFCGGVEWNYGMVGHTPFTCSPVFCASLKNKNGGDVLRVYEYERVRGGIFQIDFWISETEPRLYCAVRLINITNKVMPTYWWSNIAVPEYEKGRVIVPANEAFTGGAGEVIKVDIPYVNDTDVSYPVNIPHAMDYFYHTAKAPIKYVCYVDENGEGVLQSSTARQLGRKLFVWGQGHGAKRWQDFLAVGGPTGRYIEIQAGLAKTQYECVPQAPNSTIEWLECYSPARLDKEKAHSSFETAQKEAETILPQNLEEVLSEAREDFLKKRADKIIYKGSGWGALENLRLASVNGSHIASHLDFGEVGAEQSDWKNLVENGSIGDHKVEDVPSSFMKDINFVGLLEKAIKNKDKENWYAYMQLAAAHLSLGNVALAKKYVKISLKLAESIWALHILACINLYENKKAEAYKNAEKAFLLGKDNVFICREMLKIADIAKKHKEVIRLFDLLPDKLRDDGRLKLYLLNALIQTGEVKRAKDVLDINGNLDIDDFREGEKSVFSMYKELYGDIPVPYRINFSMSGN